MSDSALVLIRFYYIVNLYFVYNQLAQIRALGLSKASLDPVWPVFWIDKIGLETGSIIIINLSVISGFIGALFWQRTDARVLVVISQLLVAGFVNSFGAVNHGFHEWLWLGVCFLLIPTSVLSSINKSRINRFYVLIVFSLTQGLILLFYTLSGAYKVTYALIAMAAGRSNGLSPDAMALTLANRMLETNTNAIWAPFIIENYWVGWPIYLGLYYLELMAIMIFLRPDLHRIWGLALIAFHFGTFLFLEITFPTHVLINGMLFLMSPFAADKLNWNAIFRQLPVFGILLRPLLGGRAANTKVVR